MAAHAHRIGVEKVERDLVVDPLNPARGLIIGCAIGAGLWAGLIALAMA